MKPHIIGDDLLSRDENGRLRTRIATVFPYANTIVTLPGIHATQRVAFVESLNAARAARGMPCLSEAEEEREWMAAVDLVLEDDQILIRPDPADMALAFEADELLQQVVSKKKIRFLHVLNEHVRQAIKGRGECWRISPLPRSADDMKRMIAASSIGIGGRDIYAFNAASGTRLLTYAQFRSLAQLGEDQLRAHLQEIRDNCSRLNRLGNPEVGFFVADDPGLATDFTDCDFASMGSKQLWAAFESLRERFYRSVPPALRTDDPNSALWRSQMYAALIGRTDKSISEESLLGLGAEFFMQVEWVPGGRVIDGELILDPVFDEEDQTDCDPASHRICDHAARGFIFNFVRDYGDLEYVNIGRVVDSLSSRQPFDGRRGVYLAEVKQRGTERPILRIIRMQKWAVREHLDEGKDLLTAILEAEDYTEYILDRRLGCRQLGMNLSPRITARKIGEEYNGGNAAYRGVAIWSAYFERDYLEGAATDKVPLCRFEDDRFALAFASLLGRAAAPNLILGRAEHHGAVIFDDGDELIVEDATGLPIDIVVADPTGTFTDYYRDLSQAAPAYALAIAHRMDHVADANAFAEAFLDAFVRRFSQIQNEYRKRRRAFDTLFKHKRRDERGSFAYRWERVLTRLDEADAAKLADLMRKCLPRITGATAPQPTAMH